jgi:hypothetical protein
MKYLRLKKNRFRIVNQKINCEKLRGLPLNEILKIKMKEIGIEESDFLYQQ